MRFHEPLSTILSNKSKVDILRFLCQKGGEWTGRSLALELAMNPVTAHRALRELYEATVLDFRQMGNNHIYSLHDSHYLVREILRPLFERESQAREELTSRLKETFEKRIHSETVSAALYGSVVKGKEKPRSDIDLFVVVKSKESKETAQENLGRLWESFNAGFGNSLSFNIYTVAEAQEKYGRHVPLFENILRDHRLVWGKPLKEIFGD